MTERVFDHEVEPQRVHQLVFGFQQTLSVPVVLLIFQAARQREEGKKGGRGGGVEGERGGRIDCCVISNNERCNKQVLHGTYMQRR